MTTIQNSFYNLLPAVTFFCNRGGLYRLVVWNSQTVFCCFIQCFMSHLISFAICCRWRLWTKSSECQNRSTSQQQADKMLSFKRPSLQCSVEIHNQSNYKASIPMS